MSASAGDPGIAEIVATGSGPARQRRKRGGGGGVVALAMLVLTVLLIVVPPFLHSYAPDTIDLSATYVRPFASWSHLLGTDNLGRDVLSRLALGGRVSILVALPALLLNVVVGVTAGLVAGYFGGRVDSLIMGLVDLELSIPLMVLLVLVVTVVGPSDLVLVLVLGLTYWAGYARVARVVALTLRERDFVAVARTYGASAGRILRRHVLPELMGQVVIMASFDLGSIITIEASLSYLGLGPPPPTPSWGAMIQQAQVNLQSDPWLVVLPGAAIFLLVAGVQVLSQWLTSEVTRSTAPVVVL